MSRPLLKTYYERKEEEYEQVNELVPKTLGGGGFGSDRRVKKSNDQFIVRTIRNMTNKFASATTDEERQSAIMAMAAISAISLVQNPQLVQSTLKYIESRL